MRESNFSFPVQNRAAVVISSQLYDRRALDTTSPLPLFNSLTHLTYLTSTSPRIREILTIDGGLERLVRLLRDFCSHPPPPQSPRIIYGLKPAVKRSRKDKGKAAAARGEGEWRKEGAGELAQIAAGASTGAAAAPSQEGTPNPLTSFDRFSAFRFSLAFQCVVNIGVRGSEAVRARVVQAGMLDVVSSVLECWLVSKGFAVCPSPTGSGAPRESKEVRVARRMELLERRQRDLTTLQAMELARALRQLPQGQQGEEINRPGRASGVVSIPVIRTARPPTSSSQSQQPRTEHNHEVVFMDVTEPFVTEPQSSASVSSADEGQPTADDSMETEDDDLNQLGRRDTIRASSGPVRPRATPLYIDAQNTGESSTSSSGAPSSSSSSTALPVPIRRAADSFNSGSSGNVSDSVSADTSANATPLGGNTPTGSVTIEARERSGTVVARPVWDTQQDHPTPSRRNNNNRPHPHTTRHSRRDHDGSDDEGTTEAEADGEVMDHDPRTLHQNARAQQLGIEPHPARMAVIVEAGDPSSEGAGMDMNMIVDPGPLQGVGMGVEQGLVNLDMQANDDLAMGAPPGAPGAVQNVMLPTQTMTQQQQQQTQRDQQQQQQQQQAAAAIGVGGATPRQTNEMTPRAAMTALTNATPTMNNPNGVTNIPLNAAAPTNQIAPTAATPAQAITAVQLALNGLSAAGLSASGSPSLLGGGADDQSAGPYREEDVLLSLQLLAYLSKYPHVRQAFYKTRIPLGPPLLPPKPKIPIIPRSVTSFRAETYVTATNDAPTTTVGAVTSSNSEANSIPSAPINKVVAPTPIQHAPNVFSLVERFTFRPSPSELHLPRLPQEIQYWAGVIMRNACRKDETRGGIRQCANMVCGKLESFPREFAKCRRCRKAKYCGKECQSKAWADGHRFWCSSRDAEAADAAAAAQADGDGGGSGSNPGNTPDGGPPPSAPHGRTRHRPSGSAQGATGGTTTTGTNTRHHHHHHHHHGTSAPSTSENGATTTTGTAATGARPPATAPSSGPEHRSRGSSGAGSRTNPSNRTPFDAMLQRNDSESIAAAAAGLRQRAQQLLQQAQNHEVLLGSLRSANPNSNSNQTVTASTPRARIVAHALPPTMPASGSNPAIGTQPSADGGAMEVDRRSSPAQSSASIRRRAGTLPAVLSNATPPAPSGSSQLRTDPSSVQGQSGHMVGVPPRGAAEYYDRATRDLLRELEGLRGTMGTRTTGAMADLDEIPMPADGRMEYATQLLADLRNATDRLDMHESERVEVGRQRQRQHEPVQSLQQRMLRGPAAAGVDEDGDDRMGD